MEKWFIVILLMIPSVTILLIGFLHPYLYKLTKKWYFLASLSLFFLIYFFSVRYIPDFKTFINADIYSLKKNDIYTYSFYWSKILLLDMCPFLMVMISFALIFDKTKNFAKCIAPIGLIGALITLYGGSIDYNYLSQLNWSNFAKYIFLGISYNGAFNRMYFMMHYFLLIISLLAILNGNTYTKWSILSAVAFFAGYITYVLLIVHFKGIKNNATGLVSGDWYGDNYNQYGIVYSLLPMDFPGIAIFWYFVVALGNFMICFIKNYFTTDLFKIVKINQPWYSWMNKEKKLYWFLQKIDQNLIFNWKK